MSSKYKKCVSSTKYAMVFKLNYYYNGDLVLNSIPTFQRYSIMYLLDWNRDSAEKGFGFAVGGAGIVDAALGAVATGGANTGGGNGCGCE